MLNLIVPSRLRSPEPVSQRYLGRSLRRQFSSVASQNVPDQMMHLLREADARWKNVLGRDVTFDPRPKVLTAANTVKLVGAAVVLAASYEAVRVGFGDPTFFVAIALALLLAGIAACAVWLIEN